VGDGVLYVGEWWGMIILGIQRKIHSAKTGPNKKGWKTGVDKNTSAAEY